MLLNGLGAAGSCLGWGCTPLHQAGYVGPTSGRQDITKPADPITLGIYQGAAPRDVYITATGTISIPAGSTPPPGAIPVVTQETRDEAAGKKSPNIPLAKQPWFLPVLAMGGVAILFIFIKRN